MTNKKVYRCLTNNKIGVQLGTHVNQDGSVVYTLEVEGEPRQLKEATLRRWWVLEQPEETPQEQPQEVIMEEPKVEEVKEEKPKKEKGKKEPKIAESCVFFEQTAEELGGSIYKYSEPAKRVIKNKNDKPVIFYMVGPKGVKLYLKEALDETLNCPVTVEEKHTYPTQFPFRLQVGFLDDERKELLYNILKLYI